MRVKQILARILYKCIKYFKFDAPFSRLKKGNYDAILIGSIEHMNYGDHAINIAEYDFFSRKGIKFIEIPESYVPEFINNYYILVKQETTIYLHGGGNMGDVWVEQEKIRQAIFKNLPRNKIIVFPQSTNYVSDSSELLLETTRLASSVGDLTIMLRDKKSYDFVKRNFPNNVQTFLVPDMVLTLNEHKDSENKNIDVITYIRRDVEKLEDNNKKEYLNWLYSQKNISVQLDDTVRDSWTYISKNNRRKFLDKKLNTTARARLVVTDRLHGMIFAYVTGTPAIVFDNNNHKIKNLYDTWLKDVPYIYMADSDVNEILDQTNRYLKSNITFYPNEKYFIRRIDDVIK